MGHLSHVMEVSPSFSRKFEKDSNFPSRHSFARYILRFDDSALSPAKVVIRAGSFNARLRSRPQLPIQQV